jgi:hypothetical protein
MPALVEFSTSIEPTLLLRSIKDEDKPIAEGLLNLDAHS